MSYKIVATKTVNCGGVQVQTGDVLAVVNAEINLNVLQQMVRMDQAAKIADDAVGSEAETGEADPDAETAEQSETPSEAATQQGEKPAATKSTRRKK